MRTELINCLPPFSKFLGPQLNFTLCYIDKISKRRLTLLDCVTVETGHRPCQTFPIALESHGPINRDALQFLSELGRRLVETTGDVRASSFLFKRISVVVQRFNSIFLLDGFIDDDQPE